MSTTSIEWTDKVWNPTTGCAKVSTGCKYCYAEKMSKRLAAMGQEKYQGIMTKGIVHFNGRVRTHEDTLRIPFTWRKPRKVFVNSMSDLFHEDVHYSFLDRVFATMALTPQHTYQILTKRPDRMAEYLNHPVTRKDMHLSALLENHHGREKLPFVPETWPLPNVWLGTSVENQAAADERIPHLLRCPAAVRFLSCEPLVGAVDLKMYSGAILTHKIDALAETGRKDSGIHWVIAGGESGPNARPMHPDWARGLRDQCQAADVAFFFKQWGEWAPDGGPFENVHFPEEKITAVHPKKGDIGYYSEDRIDDVESAIMMRVGKKAAGRTLDGRTHDEFPKSAVNHQPSTI